MTNSVVALKLYLSQSNERDTHPQTVEWNGWMDGHQIYCKCNVKPICSFRLQFMTLNSRDRQAKHSLLPVGDSFSHPNTSSSLFTLFACPTLCGCIDLDGLELNIQGRVARNEKPTKPTDQLTTLPHSLYCARDIIMFSI